MKKVNLLSRAEMKNVMGGLNNAPCDSWRQAEFLTCWNCCITVHSYEECEKPSNCGETPIIITPE